jgi:hypothetical protein
MGTKGKTEKLMADPEAAARVDGYLKADFEAVALADLRQGQVTQPDLASGMGVSRRRISAIENTANPRIDTLRAYMRQRGRCRGADPPSSREGSSENRLHRRAVLRTKRNGET